MLPETNWKKRGTTMPHPEEIMRVRRVREGASLPQRATPGSAGLDLSACLPEPLVVPAGGRAMIPTGVAIALPDPSFVALLFARSSLGMRRGLLLTNGVGVIDSDYRGELRVPMVNLSQEAYTIQPGERVAQLCIAPVWQAAFVQAETLSDTDRGAGGFGSTGTV